MSVLADFVTNVRGAMFGVSLAAMTLAPTAASQNVTAAPHVSQATARAKLTMMTVPGILPGTGLLDASALTGMEIAPTGAVANLSLQAVLPMSHAATVRALTGLSVATLSKVFDVSRQAFHAWISGGPISTENATRLGSFLNAVEQIAQIKQPIKSFLLQQQFGVTPLELLSQGRYEAAIGMARFSDTSPRANEVMSLDKAEPGLGVVASFLYRSETQFANIDDEREIFLDDAVPVTTVVVTG